MIKRVLVLTLLPTAALADDRSYLTAFLEDNLSGAGRQVVISGFEGALSSQAKIAEMTIADDSGVWLTLRGVVLDWSRSSLLSGVVSVNELSADEIIVARMPVSPPETPAPEAGEFSLPELPVSVEIGKLAATHITLGPDILGQPVEGHLDAALSLVGGEGKANLVLERLDDGPEGRIALTASYSNANKELAVDLTAVEGEGGIASTKLDLPGHPSVSLEIHGEGPFSDFSADVTLATEGVDRLAGTVAVKAESDSITGFSADLAGDLAPLFLPDYAAFFGNQVTLQAKGQSHANGQMDLSNFALKAEAIDLTGALSIGADGQPARFDLTGQIARADGQPVLLPLTTDLPVRVQTADIHVAYDRAQSDGWTSQTTITGLDRADFRASSLALSGSGRIAPGLFGGTLSFDAEGLAPTEAALAQALGSVLSGNAVLFWREGTGNLTIPKLVLTGEDYQANITGGQVQGLADGFEIAGTLAATMADLGRISALTGQSLKGAAVIEVQGKAEIGRAHV